MDIYKKEGNSESRDIERRARVLGDACVVGEATHIMS